MNAKRLFNDGWEFLKLQIGSGAKEMQAAEALFVPVDIPHDWLIGQAENLYEDSVGWYRKNWKFESEPAAGHIFLEFEGVYMDSEIYVNGEKIFAWENGYSTFEVELTPYLVPGINEILVRVNHQSPNSRWYSGAGIYRNIWLKVCADTRVASHGIYISTEKAEKGWLAEAETEVHLTGAVLLRQTILEKGSRRMVIQPKTKLLAPAEEGDAKGIQSFFLDRVQVWDLETPYLYLLVTELLEQEEVVYREETSFGFRTIEFRPDHGFFLNGRRRKLNGTCEHHDLGCLGAAYHREAMAGRMKLLKEMGVNAIRTSHNMPAPGLMELADEMGLLIQSESFDMWERSKTEFDYARFFPSCYKKDVASWVRRDRNHPSLIMWSIGNEIFDTHADSRGAEITRELMNEVKKHDPKGNASITLGSNYMPWENARNCADIVKLAGYNYSEKYYEAHHQDHPDWIVYGSETASVVSSRGIYHFPFAKSVLADEDLQCSALGNSTTSWGARSLESCIVAERDCDFSCGQFIWSGFDYIGEPTPYHTKNSYFGQLDTAGFPKDSYYLLQAEWTDYRTSPMIHIFPYWDFNEGQTIDVRVCTNAPRLELFLNGTLLGSFEPDHKQGNKLAAHYQVPYSKGKLEAFAYDEEGAVIASERRLSFGDGKRICLKPHKRELRGDGEDLLFLEISTEDDNGNPVENDNRRVSVRVSGAGRLIGLDNGDSTDYESYKGVSRRLFGGKLLAVIGARAESGHLLIEAESAGIETARFELDTLSAPVRPGIASAEENTKTPQLYSVGEPDLPIRKIELICSGKTALDADCSQAEVKVKLWPEDAGIQELTWAVVDDSGIVSNLAAVSITEQGAVVTAKGDGSFRLRCKANNGLSHTALISQLDFTVTGMGKAYLDPYEFVAGGLCQYVRGNAGNGNEHGVATARDGETVVGFRDLDFGRYGSDEITVPIFALSGEEYPIELWEGIPGEDQSELLAAVVYQKPSIWNVYQEDTYRLNKRLKGVTTLSFVVRQKVHIKGFSFRRINPAFERLEAVDNQNVYGDCFTVAERGINGIGNNVTIEFGTLDFGAEGIDKITLCGKSHIEKNAIHIRFEGADGEQKQLVEFDYSPEEAVREFKLEPVTGIQRVTFVFLPGSKFDFSWFCFQSRTAGGV